MFDIEVEKYHAKGIRVVPIVPNGKHCPIDDWLDIDFYELKDKYKSHGVGLSLGDSDLVVLDMDTKDENEKKEYEEFLKDYPTPIMRQGHPNKLPSRFYSKTWQTGKTKLNNLELLNTTNDKMMVCVLPPTKHPEFKDVSFEWVTKNNLLNFDLSLLPPFPIEAWEGMKKIKEKYLPKNIKREISQSDGTRCNHGSHDYLSAIVTGHARDGESVEYIMGVLLKEDEAINPKVSYFLCPSRKEFKSKNKEDNCRQFVTECVRNQIKKGKVERVEIGSSPEKPMLEAVKKNFKSLAKHEGFGKVLFDDLYKNSPIQRSQLCHMNVLNLLSILIGNKVFYKGTAANLYLYGVAPSGFGKDFSFKRSKDLLLAAGLKSHIASSSPTSDSVVLTSLTKINREQCYFINEAETLLKRITSERMNFGLRECLTDLFDYPGRSFTPKLMMTENKKGKDLTTIGDVFSPFLNVLMTSTTSAFNRYAAQNVFETGFGSRFLYFFEDRYKEQAYVEDFNPPFSKEIIEEVKLFKGSEPFLKVNDSDEKFTPYNVRVTEKAKEYDRQLHLKLETEKKQMQDHKFFSIITRKYYFINKLALIHHCMVNPSDYLEKPLDFESIEWAEKDVNAIVHNMLVYLDDSVAESDYGRKLNSIMSYIKKRTIKGEGTTKKEVSQRFSKNITKIERANILSDLMEQEAIFVKDKELYAAKQ